MIFSFEIMHLWACAWWHLSGYSLLRKSWGKASAVEKWFVCTWVMCCLDSTPFVSSKSVLHLFFVIASESISILVFAHQLLCYFLTCKLPFSFNVVRQQCHMTTSYAWAAAHIAQEKYTKTKIEKKRIETHAARGEGGALSLDTVSGSFHFQ